MKTIHTLLAAAILCALCTVPSFAAPITPADFNKATDTHINFVLAMLQIFMQSPEVHDIAKVSVASQMEPIARNTALTVAYESMVLTTKGAVCQGEVADSIPARLRFSDATRAPVMFNPGSLIYVNTAYFRDLCVLYKKAPERVRDLYSQHMTQIKRTTGGKTYDELKK
jgi:hypothetical protein